MKRKSEKERAKGQKKGISPYDPHVLAHATYTLWLLDRLAYHP